MIKVNLVPSEILAKARQRQLALQAGLVGGLLGVVLVMISVLHWFGLHNLQGDYEYKKAKLQKLAAIVSQVEEQEKAAAAVRARLGVIESLLKGRAFYPMFMSEFARTVPQKVRVMSMSTASQPNNSAVKLSISATAASSDDIAMWMRTLEKNGHFAPPELGPVTASGPAQFSFTLTTVYTLKL
jgi:Tfp pilus assembly protein PilN